MVGAPFEQILVFSVQPKLSYDRTSIEFELSKSCQVPLNSCVIYDLVWDGENSLSILCGNVATGEKYVKTKIMSDDDEFTVQATNTVNLRSYCPNEEVIGLYLCIFDYWCNSNRPKCPPVYLQVLHSYSLSSNHHFSAKSYIPVYPCYL